MSEELRFSFVTLFKKFWHSLNRRSLCKPVRPTLHLSKEALETPLPEGLLRDIRDFLTRSGPWKDHPVDSVEVFMAIPAPGVSVQNPLPSVVGIDKPVFTSLGFGMEGITDGVARYTTGVCEVLNNDANCDTLICITQTTQPVTGRVPMMKDDSEVISAACYDNYCGQNDCFTDNCSSQKCGGQSCRDHFCADHFCGTKKSRVAFSSELETHWQHPFVQELGRYFRIDMLDDLAAAVKQYVGRNMFDGSAQRKHRRS